MSDTNVSINFKTGDPANDRHMGRYLRCLYEFVKELSTIDENVKILEKYDARLLDNNRVNLDFPSDFDQSKLPKELQ
jgi:hypothetical protein